MIVTFNDLYKLNDPIFPLLPLFQTLFVKHESREKLKIKHILI